MRVKRSLTAEQIYSIAANCEPPLLRVAVLIAVLLRLRRSEIASLTDEQITYLDIPRGLWRQIRGLSHPRKPPFAFLRGTLNARRRLQAACLKANLPEIFFSDLQYVGEDERQKLSTLVAYREGTPAARVPSWF